MVFGLRGTCFNPSSIAYYMSSCGQATASLKLWFLFCGIELNRSMVVANLGLLKYISVDYLAESRNLIVNSFI